MKQETVHVFDVTIVSGETVALYIVVSVCTHTCMCTYNGKRGEIGDDAGEMWRGM